MHELEKLFLHVSLPLSFEIQKCIKFCVHISPIYIFLMPGHILQMLFYVTCILSMIVLN